jgi:hypothetical protein
MRCMSADPEQRSPLSWWRVLGDTDVIDDRTFRIHIGISAVQAALISLIWFAIGGWLLAAFTFVMWFAILGWKGKRAHDRYRS